MSSTFYMQRVVVFLYGVSRCLLRNLTDLHWKPSACISLHVDMVPMTYYHGWPSVEGGVKVAIEVCSDTTELKREHSACRLLMIID
jgi:hypothetical protein